MCDCECKYTYIYIYIYTYTGYPVCPLFLGGGRPADKLVTVLR